MSNQPKRTHGSDSGHDGSNRPHLVRQDRIEIVADLCTAEINGEHYEVINYSAFGFALFSRTPLSSTAEPQAVTISIGNTILAKTSAKVVRTLSTDSGHVTGFEVLGAPLDRDQFESTIEAKNIVDALKEKAESYNKIPEGFRHLTYELRQLLSELQNEIEARKETHNFSSSSDLKTWEDSVVGEVAGFLQASLEPHYNRMKICLSSLGQEDKKSAFEFFRSQLKDLIYQSPFTYRTYTKPLGYAGDYEMMNIIYRNENIAGSTFGKCLQRYFLDYKESKAVRNRATFLLEKIITFTRAHRQKSESKVRILSVASGPAMELQLLIEKMRGFDFSNVEFVLLDQDAVSLKHAQYKIRELSRIHGVEPKVHYLHKNIKHVITGALADSQFDLIYSAGLFDYFSDPVAQMAASALYKSLDANGHMIIGNFDVSAPNQFVMELAVDWNLIYRSADDLKALFGGIAPKLSVEKESEGVNLFSVLSN